MVSPLPSMNPENCVRKVLIWSLYTYPAAPNPPTTPTKSAPASNVPVIAPEPPAPSSSFSSSSGMGRRSLGLPLPPPPRRKGTLGDALRSVALLGSRREESGGWNARPRCSKRRRHGEAPSVAGGEKWEERTGEGEGCGERCGCLMEGAWEREGVRGWGPSASSTAWWGVGVRPLELGSDKRREQREGEENGKALEKKERSTWHHVGQKLGVGPFCQCDAGLVLSTGLKGYQTEKLLVRFQLRGLQNSLVSKQHGTWVFSEETHGT